MVLFKTAVAGASMLTVGVLLLLVLGSYITVQVQEIENRSIEPHAEFLVGDLVDRTYSIPGSVPVSGTVGVTEAPTNASGDVRFMVFDEANYQKWNAGQQADYLFSTDGRGQFVFNFTTLKSGIYHFVFDNRASLFKKYIVLSIGYSDITVSYKPDPRVPYLGWGLLAVGAAVLGYGLIRKPQIPWS